MTTLFVSPSGVSDGSTPSEPCSVSAAQRRVRSLVSAGRTHVVVELADGVYRFDEPLVFRAADAGGPDGWVRWTAAADARPVFTGAEPVTGWRVHDSERGIWVADTPSGVDSRQLYVNGVIAPRASVAVAADDIVLDDAGIGLVADSLAYLERLPGQHRIEFETKGDFTYRYSPVASIAAGRVTMAQPAWENNTWGWDTVQYALMGGSTYRFSNSLAFLDEVGEWYLDPERGALYFKPGVGVDPNMLDIQLPRLEVLVSVSGTYDRPLQHLAFEGITFTGTSWMGPTDHGLASQQNGTYLKDALPYRPTDAFTTCGRGCSEFERARTIWHQQPAAVQVSAARGVRFEGNVFTNLGSTALGIGNDATASASGVGLGVDDVAVVGNRFTEISGHAICVGGVRPEAHHPSDERMANRNVTLAHNTINRVAVDYKDNSGILSTYVSGARILHNEVANVAYDGIDTGYGWGMNDAGGSEEYTGRGYYIANPRYETPTTLRDNVVAGNIVRNAKSQFADGGSIYHLSAAPGSITERNHVYNVSGVGLYLDEGTRYVQHRHNVLQDTDPWVFTNTYGSTNTRDNVIRGNWHNSGSEHTPHPAENNNRLVANTPVVGADWPAAARRVIAEAGVAPVYRTGLNGNLFAPDSRDPAHGERGWAIAPPLATAATDAGAFFGERRGHFAIRAAGGGVGDAGRRADEYGAIYLPAALGDAGRVTARVDTVGDAHPAAKSGVMIRDDMAAAGVSAGYAIIAVTPRSGIVFAWDTDADGHLDSSVTAAVDTFRPVWVRLERSGEQVAGFYSFDGVNYAQLGAAVSVPGSAVRDAGIFSSSSDPARSAVNVFSGFAVTGDPARASA